MDQARLRTVVRPDIKEGLEAYSAKQASILSRMGKAFADEWYPILTANQITADWPEEYLDGSITFVLPEVTPPTVQDDSDDEDLFLEDDILE
jgi:hypothetical protein